LLQAYAYARDPRQSLEAIAKKVGYSAPRMLTKHMRSAVGATPRAIRRLMRPTEFVYALAQWLVPTPARAALLTAAPVLSDTSVRAIPLGLEAPVDLIPRPELPSRPLEAPSTVPTSVEPWPRIAAPAGSRVSATSSPGREPGATGQGGKVRAGPPSAAKLTRPSP
jgi:hypothetical protein